METLSIYDVIRIKQLEEDAKKEAGEENGS